MFKRYERKVFSDLLNRQGYVLDFSTQKFNDFTEEIVGIPLCEKYQLSKGKSLEQFIEEGEDEKVLKLLSELLKYYEINYSKELEEEKIINNTKCNILLENSKKILEDYNKSKSSNLLTEIAKELKEEFSTEYMNKQIEILINDNNPTEAIGKAKELIESCCKTILENREIKIEKDSNINKLVKDTMNCLKIPNEALYKDSKEQKIVEQIIGNLKGVSSGISELRNHYGSGHGRNIKFKSLSKKHSDLAVYSSIALVKYLWETYKEKKSL